MPLGGHHYTAGSNSTPASLFMSPFHVPTVEAFHASTDSFGSASTEFKPPPKDSRALAVVRSEMLPKIAGSQEQSR